MTVADRVVEAELPAAAAADALRDKDDALAAPDLLKVPVGDLRLVKVEVKVKTAVIAVNHNDGVAVGRKVLLVALAGRLQQGVPACAEVRIELPIAHGTVLVQGFDFLKSFPVAVHVTPRIHAESAVGCRG